MLRQPHLQIIAARKSTQRCSVVPQYTKDHLKSIIFLTPDWPGNATTQMILGIMVHRQRVTSSSLGWCPPPKKPNKKLPTQSEIQTQCVKSTIKESPVVLVAEVAVVMSWPSNIHKQYEYTGLNTIHLQHLPSLDLGHHSIFHLILTLFLGFRRSQMPFECDCELCKIGETIS